MTVLELITMLWQYPLDAQVMLPIWEEVGPNKTDVTGVEMSDSDVVILD